MRNSALSATDRNTQVQAEAALTTGLKSLFVLAEDYPELKANQNFLELQSQLADIEDHIQNARRYYNAVTRDYNILCDQFPSVIIARIFNFSKVEFFKMDEQEEENIKISL